MPGAQAGGPGARDRHGSGYQTALLAELCREVDSIERIPELAEAARARLREMGTRTSAVRVADGTLGWPEKAPYDAIVVSAAAPRIPQPLLDQLADGGRMVVPVGDLRGQNLVLVERKGARVQDEEHLRLRVRQADRQGRVAQRGE